MRTIVITILIATAAWSQGRAGRGNNSDAAATPPSPDVDAFINASYKDVVRPTN